MCRASQQAFVPTQHAPDSARRFLTGYLTACLAGSNVADNASPVLSELVTNALHTGSPQLSVDVDLHRDHHVLAVTDDGPGLPAVQHPTPDQTHGRGLLIMDTLTTRWGLDTRPHTKGFGPS